MERERILQFTLEEENGKYYFDVESNSRLLFKSRLFETKQKAKDTINYLASLAVTDQEFVDNTSRYMRFSLAPAFEKKVCYTRSLSLREAILEGRRESLKVKK